MVKPLYYLACKVFYHFTGISINTLLKHSLDIKTLNSELKTTVAKIDKLRADIDKIVAEIEA